MAKDKGIFVGLIEKDDKGNYFSGPYLLDYQYTETNKFKVGDKISIKSAVANPSSASNEKYPKKSRNFFLYSDAK
ncbi:hypothetical protein [Flavobacterium selenitireducens]|uniref:hypothetical protein n=1 Tax=Flavobacterium selenitireducens TaxID=2722704 RepID=UPI00168B149A|nr:hypothetical protein [Flavobacterium selenitireducens]MBD3582328.1 hypothetical protein [Flavobacterium selenitireducens]